MDAGIGVIVTVAVAGEPQPFEYWIIAFPPDTPLTTPVVLPTVATPVALLLQVPPLDVSVNVVEVLAQVTRVPPIAAGT